MAIQSQKTALYVVDDGSTVTKVGCPTSISGAGSTNESIETTCLGDDTRTYVRGLATPGEVSFDLHFDPSDDSHMTLKDLHESGDTVAWCIAFSDGDSEPTYTEGWDVTGRSVITFEGFLTSFEFSFEQNDVVGASVGVQITGHPTVKAA